MIDEMDRPVLGAVISLPHRIGTTVSDSQGLFETEDPKGDAYVVHARKGSLVGQAQVGGSDDLIYVRMIVGVTLTIAVYDEDTGSAIAGAEVAGLGYYAVTGTDGKAIISGVVPGSAFFRMAAAGYQQMTFYCHGEPGATVMQVLSPKPGVPVDGTVMDHAGEPIANATVTVRDEDKGTSAGSTMSDASGHWRIPALGLGTYRISASVDSFVVAEAAMEVNSKSRQSLVLRQPQRVELYGIVQDSSGRGIPGAIVRAPPNSTITDPNGYFSMLTSQQEISLWASAGEYSSAVIHVSMAAPPRDVRLVVSRTLVSGLVLDRQDQPFAGAVVTLRSSDGLLPEMRRTDESGRFEFKGVPLGRYKLTAAESVFENDASAFGSLSLDANESTIETTLTLR